MLNYALTVKLLAATNTLGTRFSVTLHDAVTGRKRTKIYRRVHLRTLTEDANFAVSSVINSIGATGEVFLAETSGTSWCGILFARQDDMRVVRFNRK